MALRMKKSRKLHELCCQHDTRFRVCTPRTGLRPPPAPRGQLRERPVARGSPIVARSIHSIVSELHSPSNQNLQSTEYTSIAVGCSIHTLHQSLEAIDMLSLRTVSAKNLLRELVGENAPTRTAGPVVLASPVWSSPRRQTKVGRRTHEFPSASNHSIHCSTCNQCPKE